MPSRKPLETLACPLRHQVGLYWDILVVACENGIISDLNYLVSRRLMDVLAETELGGKNMLGQYQSPVIKGLAEVLKMYEKDNIYLGRPA